MLEKSNSEISVTKQCKMLNVARSSYYVHMREKVDTDGGIKGSIDKIYEKRPAYGSRRITEILNRQGVRINRKRTQRLMREMNICGMTPKQNLSKAKHKHEKYPYIARNKPITRINQVLSTD